MDLDVSKGDMEWVRIQGGVVSGDHILLPHPCPKVYEGRLCSVYDGKPPFCTWWPGPYDECDLDWLKDLGCKFFEE